MSTLDVDCCICPGYEKSVVHVCKKQNSTTFQFFKKMFEKKKKTINQQLILSAFLFSSAKQKQAINTFTTILELS